MQQVILCGGDAKFQIKCPSTQYIYVYAAYFGIEPSTNLNLCVLPPASVTSTTTCYNQQALVYASGLCNGQNRCSLSVAGFSNPCSGSVVFATQLMVQYQCVDFGALDLIMQCGLNTTAAAICAPLNDINTQYEAYWCDPLSVSTKK
jgi:hypothetical protein